MIVQQAVRSGATDAAGTVNIAIPESGLGARYAALYGNFVYGSGGTTIKCYLEGSYDFGTTWVPIANMTFALASDAKLLTVVPASNAAFDADAAQTDNAITSHIAPRLRIRVVTTGTYSGSTLGLWFHMYG